MLLHHVLHHSNCPVFRYIVIWASYIIPYWMWRASWIGLSRRPMLFPLPQYILNSLFLECFHISRVNYLKEKHHWQIATRGFLTDILPFGFYLCMCHSVQCITLTLLSVVIANKLDNLFVYLSWRGFNEIKQGHVCWECKYKPWLKTFIKVKIMYIL